MDVSYKKLNKLHFIRISWTFFAALKRCLIYLLYPSYPDGRNPLPRSLVIGVRYFKIKTEHKFYNGRLIQQQNRVHSKLSLFG